MGRVPAVTSLVEVAVHVPQTSVGVGDIGRELDLDPRLIRAFERIYGLESVRLAPGETAVDLMVAAASRLQLLRGREQDVRYVLQARTVETVAPYAVVNPLQETCRALGLENAVAFCVTQHACASGLLAVSLAGRLLAADPHPGGLALVLTGEKAYTRTTRMIPNTTFMGESTAAALVGATGDHDRMIGYATRSYGQFSSGVQMSDQLKVEFDELYQTGLTEVIRGALDTAGSGVDGLSLILPHNVNRISWIRTCKLLGIPMDSVLTDNLRITGHCFCADPFVNLATAIASGRLKPGDRYLMAAVGLGATFSAMVFEH
jgi:3-oxoacyl-[acyl-carrier-protein] synthase-3